MLVNNNIITERPMSEYFTIDVQDYDHKYNMTIGRSTTHQLAVEDNRTV